MQVEFLEGTHNICGRFHSLRKTLLFTSINPPIVSPKTFDQLSQPARIHRAIEIFAALGFSGAPTAPPQAPTTTKNLDKLDAA